MGFQYFESKECTWEGVRARNENTPEFLDVSVNCSCVFEPRSQKYADIVDQEWLSVKDQAVEWTKVKSAI